MNLPEFTKKPDAIALDLDGTFFNSTQEISERNLRAVNRCIDAGIPVILATSRPTRLFHRALPEEFSKRVSYTVMNGAVTSGRPPLSGNFLEPIPAAVARTIIDIALNTVPDVRITIEIEGYEFGANWTADADTLWRNNSATPDMVLRVDEAIQRQPCKIALSSTERNIMELKTMLESCLGSQMSLVPALMWQPMLNITNPGVSKTQALKRLLEPSGKSLDNTVSFGDDYPDLEMLHSCRYGIAMENAFPDVKASCAYTTASNDNDGVAEVLERIPGLP